MATQRYIKLRYEYLYFGVLPSNNEFLVKLLTAYFDVTKSIFVNFKFIYNFIEFIEDAIISCLRVKSLRFLFLKLGLAAREKSPKLARFYFYVESFRFASCITLLGLNVFNFLAFLL